VHSNDLILTYLHLYRAYLQISPHFKVNITTFQRTGVKIVFVNSDAITKYLRLSGLNNRNLFSHSSEDWKSKIKVPAGLVSGETSLLRLQKAVFLFVLMQCRERELVSLPLLIRTPALSD